MQTMEANYPRHRRERMIPIALFVRLLLFLLSLLQSIKPQFNCLMHHHTSFVKSKLSFLP